MAERTACLYPIPPSWPAQLGAVRYATLSGETLRTFDNLPAIAAHLLDQRKGRAVRVDDSALVWGDGDGESRAAIAVVFTGRDGAEQRLSVLAWSERAGDLWAALQAARAAA